MPKFIYEKLEFSCSWTDHASIMELLQSVDPQFKYESMHQQADAIPKPKPKPRDMDMKEKVIAFLKSKGERGATGKEIRKGVRSSSYSSCLARLEADNLVAKEGQPKSYRYFWTGKGE